MEKMAKRVFNIFTRISNYWNKSKCIKEGDIVVILMYYNNVPFLNTSS